LRILDKAVTVQVLDGTLFQEDVRFVKEEHISVTAKLEDRRKTLLVAAGSVLNSPRQFGAWG